MLVSWEGQDCTQLDLMQETSARMTMKLGSCLTQILSAKELTVEESLLLYLGEGQGSK